MKALSFEHNGQAGYGLQLQEGVRAASRDLQARYPDLKALLTAGALDALPGSLDETVIDAATLHYLPPVPVPGKIICVGVNYRPHVEEMGREVPEKPLLFVRFPGSLVGHKAQLLRPAISEQYDFEGELAIIIGKAAHRVSRNEAWQTIAGYSCFMDGSVRDWQRHTSQFTAGKNFEKSGSMGPWLTTPDEIDDLPAQSITTRVNGQIMQNGKINELIFDIPALIEYCSAFTKLLPGDVIATGTPGGVGAARKPPLWLRPGDELAVDLGPVGCLCNPVIAE